MAGSSSLLRGRGLLPPLDRAGILRLTLETLRRTRREFRWVCGTPEPSIFESEEFVSLVREKAERGVSCLFIGGPAAIVSRRSPGELPFLGFLKEIQADPELRGRVCLFVRVRRPPVIHYMLADERFAVVEEFHCEWEEAPRRFKVIRDTDVAEAFAAWARTCVARDLREIHGQNEYEALTKDDYRAKFGTVFSEVEGR